MTSPATAARATTSTDLGLAAEGVRRITWAEREMPVLRLIRERFERDRRSTASGSGPASTSPRRRRTSCGR